MANTTRLMPEIRIDGTNPKALATSVEKLQFNLKSVLNPILALLTNNGVYQTVDVVIGKDNFISHKLGREYIGFSTYGDNGGIRVWESSTPNPNRDKFLILVASNTGTVNLWVV